MIRISERVVRDAKKGGYTGICAGSRVRGCRCGCLDSVYLEFVTDEQIDELLILDYHEISGGDIRFIVSDRLVVSEDIHVFRMLDSIEAKGIRVPNLHDRGY